jgi:hypothetical protein
MAVNRDDMGRDIEPASWMRRTAASARVIQNIGAVHVLTCTWVGLVVCEIGRRVLHGDRVGFTMSIAYIAILVAVMALLDRRRWGRLALLGLGGCHIAAVACAALAAGLQHGTGAIARACDPSGSGPVIMSLMIANDFFTLVALCWPSVRADFVYRKSAGTGRLQLLIALLVIAVPVSGLIAGVISGLASPVALDIPANERPVGTYAHGATTRPLRSGSAGTAQRDATNMNGLRPTPH